MMNVYANVKGVFNLLELNWGDIPLPDRGDEINLGGFLTSEDRLKLAKQDANMLWPNRGYEGMTALDALDFVSCIAVRRHFFKDIGSGEVDVWLSLRFETK